MSITAADLVKAGAEFLDSKVSEFPVTLEDWRGKINLYALDLSSPRNCILGQLFSSYTRGKEDLGLYDTEGCECGCDYDCDYGQAYGFVDGNHATNSELDAAWKAYLKGETPSNSGPKLYVSRTSSNSVYMEHGRITSTTGRVFIAIEQGTFGHSDKFVGNGNISMWTPRDVADILKPYVPFEWAEGDHLVANGPLGIQAFLVKSAWNTGNQELRIWRLNAMPSHAPEDYWNEKGYTNFRKITI